MNRKIVGMVVMGIVLPAFADVAHAENSSAAAGIDAALQGAVERNDVPGVVALIADRRGVRYQGAFGAADVSTGRGYSITSAILRDFKPQPGESDPFGGSLLFDLGERWHYGTSIDVVGKLL